MGRGGASQEEASGRTPGWVGGWVGGAGSLLGQLGLWKWDGVNAQDAQVRGSGSNKALFDP